ncbi:MAG: class I SAM-dependent methyltransferase [Gammaproteobacteria bacterium]|nr:class I SAM-dependent methyltransferase [Gammaproteobacteria bacterium]
MRTAGDNRRWCRWLAVVLSLAVALGAGGLGPLQAATGADPAINLPYEDPELDVWVRRFERPGREVYDRRQEIVGALGLRRGMDVADVGAGTGLFTRLIAPEVVPGGRVYAVDVSETFVRNVEAAAEARGLDNVVGVVNTQAGVALPPRSIDLAFICDTYHHFERPREMMVSIHAALRPGGRVAVIDFRRREEVASSWVMAHVRAGKQQVIEEVRAAGFRPAGEEDFLRVNYFLWFEKR